MTDMQSDVDALSASFADVEQSLPLRRRAEFKVREKHSEVAMMHDVHM